MQLQKSSSRFVIEVLPRRASTLARDVREGLSASPKWLPSKYFYDETGSILFDRICETEEYYPTRAEAGLLAEIAEELVTRFRPTHLVELGSGPARKARTILGAFERRGQPCTYVPFDVSESMLRASARSLLQEFSWLEVHGLVGDYDFHLESIPRKGRRLVAFLGGTIGNFTEEEAVTFLGRIASTLREDDRLLLGTDLLKSPEVLHRAYNDAQGLTAAFNRNILQVINRELGADFALERFTHLAFLRPEASQIEMHLRAEEAHEVHIPRLGLRIPFSRGETIRTEISRKFTRQSVERLLAKAGLRLEAWYASPDPSFGLSVSRRSPVRARIAEG